MTEEDKFNVTEDDVVAINPITHAAIIKGKDKFLLGILAKSEETVLDKNAPKNKIFIINKRDLGQLFNWGFVND